MESFSAGIERLQGRLSVLGWIDSSGVILSQDRTTPGESFSPGIERLQGVFLSWDETTPGESFSPGIEQLQGRLHVLG